MAELVAASMSNLQGPMLHTAASEEFSVGFFKILPSATRNAQKMQSFVKTVASSDVLGSPTLQGSLGLEHTQRDKSKSGERLLEESISGEKYPQLQVMNCKKLKVPDSRYKVLEVHEIYSKVTKSISQPIIKHGSAVQAKNKYPSFNFDTMREALASNNFPQAKAEILELDSMYKLSQDQWTSLKTSCTPCTKRCLLGEFTPSSKHRSTQERVAAIELGTWYNEQLLKLHKNQADNSFANSNTLYSFVFRELLKLQTTECSQMAQLLLMLYMHSVSLIETGWKCSKTIHNIVRVPANTQQQDTARSDPQPDLLGFDSQLKSSIGINIPEPLDSQRSVSEMKSISRRNIPIIKIGKEEIFSKNRAAAGYLEASATQNSPARGSLLGSNFLMVPKVSIGSPPVVFKDRPDMESQDPTALPNAVLKPQVFKFTRKKYKQPNISSEQTLAEHSVGDLSNKSENQDNGTEIIQIVVRPMSGGASSLQSGKSLSTSSDKLSRHSDKPHGGLRESLSEDGN